MRVAFAMLMGSMTVGCATIPPESDCAWTGWAGDSAPECSPETPMCTPEGTCSHACTASADCADLVMQTTCDEDRGSCALPCTADSRSNFVCRGGERLYCRDDLTSSLPCSVCPNVCGSGSFCDGSACQAQRAAGEPCATDVECASYACTDAGLCSVAQGEACSDADCDGVCASRPSGERLCIRSRCPSDCAESMAGGLEWYCARYESYEACVPLERCVWQGGCSSLADSTCGQSCRSGGGCWTYCVPDVISTDD